MRQLLTAALALSLISGTALAATPAEKGKESVKEKVHQLQMKKEALSFEQALRAVAYTDKVIFLLEHGKKEEALKLLNEAQKSLNEFLKLHPNLQLLPLDQQIIVLGYNGDVKTAQEALKKVKELLQKGRVQDARLLLAQLVDEIDVVTTYLPVAMYNHILALAKQYVQEGKIQEAIQTLALVRGSLIIDEVAIPIPFIKAQEFIKDAISVAKKDKKKAIEFVEAARKELQLARVLGYAYDYQKAYEELEKELEKVEKELKSGKESGSLLKKIEGEIHSLGQKARTERKK
ncbi:YfdX family protein [Thermovibrio ammonificans]|jgi:tetratricopeptide (TPR) repeat protein|uniref:YfdX protein n=1 Tax=Thermovibrio ammonificans (strain DSM 15698 / JCM 12110 / HB-1) TaxID=648996 RepID=E8T3F3_THEA1|nr:YfdX family protein [Thermovibrio ammonificans]ADU97285.1 hypothetical protein Theam_1322 [Thermovibrio ammonificans HB-1]